MKGRAPDRPPRDLDTRAEVHDLVIDFYRAIVFDDLLGPVFDEVAEVDWTVHIPRLIDYWSRVVLGQRGYDGYVLAAHEHVHELESFTPVLFDRWYSLWIECVDASWEGPHAERAKRHAARTARALAHRLLGTDWSVPSSPGTPAFRGSVHS